MGYFPLPDPYSVGLGWDGTYIWIAAGDQAGPPCHFYIFDECGNQIDMGAQGGGATGWGHRDLAWNGRYFYTGGFGTNLYRLAWNGIWGSSAVVTDLGGPYRGTYGLAYECMQGCLWCTTAASTGEIRQFDRTGFPQHVYVDPAHLTFGGCEMAYTVQYGGVLAALVQESPDGVVFYNVGAGPSPVEPASWGRIKALFR